MTSGSATLDRLAAEAAPQTESLATRLVGAAAELGARPRPGHLEAATAAVLALERATGLHDELLDSGAARAEELPPRDPRWAALAGASAIGAGAERIAECGDDAAAAWAGAARELVEARMLEVQDLYDPGRSVARRLAVAEQRTGALLAVAARLGAILADADAEAIEASAELGRRLGVAVELENELSDAGIGSGRYPAALHYAIEADPGLAEGLGRPLSEAEVLRVMEAIEIAGGFDRAREECDRHLAAARSVAEGLGAAALVALVAGAAPSR